MVDYKGLALTFDGATVEAFVSLVDEGSEGVCSFRYVILVAQGLWFPAVQGAWIQPQPVNIQCNIDTNVTL